MTAMTRGPLPARVYWVRRILVLGTALALVFGISRILLGGSDASSDDPAPTAVRAAGEPTSALSGLPSATTSEKAKKPRKKKQKKTPKEPVLAVPDGPCVDSDIVVEPTVARAIAGESVFFVLELRTLVSEACTWRVGPESVTVKLTSGKDDIWTSRQCPAAIPSSTVIVRKAVTTKIGVRWSGRRSDSDCSKRTEWALPGWYHINAAALAGEPSDLQFELAAPSAPVVTRTPEPEKKRNRSGQQEEQGQKTKPRDRPHSPQPDQKQR